MGLVRKANRFIILNNYFSLFITGSHRHFQGSNPVVPTTKSEGLAYNG
jgi:hypothetical protein